MMKPRRLLAFAAVLGLLATGYARADRLHTAGPAAPAPTAAPAANAASVVTGDSSGPLTGRFIRTPAPSVTNGRALPPIPPAPAGKGIRETKSANGSRISLFAQSGCSGTTRINFNVGCTVAATYLPGPNVVNTGNRVDLYLLPANQTTPTLLTTATATGSNAISLSSNVTFSLVGVWVIGAFNEQTNTWDALIYVPIGSLPSIATYDGTLTATSTFVANGSNVVKIVADGLTNGNSYAVTVEETSVSGACAYISNVASPSPAPFPAPTPLITLCKPLNDPSGIPAVNNQIAASWIPEATRNGTYAISVWDITNRANPVRQLQITVSLSGTAYKPTPTSPLQAAPQWSLSPNPGLFPAVNPAIFAFYSPGEALGGASIADIFANVSVPAVLGGHSFTVAVSDPTGNVIGGATTTQTAAPTGGQFGTAFHFPVYSWANAFFGSNVGPYAGSATSTIKNAGFLTSGYALSLLDTTQAPNQIVSSTHFKLVGFSGLLQWDQNNTPTTSISTGGIFTNNVTTPFLLTNDGDNRFGLTNSDALNEWLITPPSSFSITFTDGSTGTRSFNDQNGKPWNATIACSATSSYFYGTYPTSCSLDISPQNPQTFTNPSGVSLAPNGALTTMAFIVTDTNFGCELNNGGACTITAQVKPVHGSGALAKPGSVVNAVTFLTGTSILTGTASLALYGYAPTSSNVVRGGNAYQYLSRNSQSLYSGTLGQSSGSNDDVYALTISSGNTSIGALQLTLPSGYDASQVIAPSAWSGGAAGLNANWTAGRCANAPASQYLCLSGGPISSFTTTTLYFGLRPPTQAFTYTSVTVAQSTTPGVYGNAGTNLPPSGTVSVYEGTNPSQIDALSIAAYGLDATLIQAGFSPATLGNNQTNAAVSFGVTNANLSIGQFPDYLDAIVLEMPPGITISSNGASNPAGWTLQATTTSGPSGTQYWFTTCPQQVPSGTYAPTATGALLSVPVCTTTPPATTLLGPAKSWSYPLTIGNTGGGGSIAARAYVHGANGGGWSQSTPVTIALNNLAAASGFSAVGSQGSPSAVASGNEPAVSQSASSPSTSTYVYRFTNTGNTTLNAFNVILPGTDTSGANAFDGVRNWSVAAPPTVLPVAPDTSTYGCSVVGSTNATPSGGNGGILVGGCSLPTGKSIDLSFDAVAPTIQGNTYRFASYINPGSTTGTSGVAMGQRWYSDQLMLVQSSATLSIYVPTNGTTSSYATLTPALTGSPSPTSCTGSPALTGCSYTTSPATVDFLTVAATTTKTIQDAVLVRLQNANAPRGWNLYVATSTNNSYSGGGSELQTLFDVNRSTSGVNLSQSAGSSYTDIPTGSPGLLIASNGTNAAITTPYDMFMNLQVRIGTESLTTALTRATVTYTYIPN